METPLKPAPTDAAQRATPHAAQATLCRVLGGCALVLLALSSVIIGPGCNASDPKLAEAFAGQREAMLARSLRTAAEMHERAAATADAALTDADQAVQARRTDFDSYEDARRALLSTEGRIRDAGNHAERVEFVASELFDQWRRDLRQYTSDELREQARNRFDDFQTRTDAAIKDFKEARETIEPVRRRVIDAALWLKHHRHQASPPDPTRTAADQAALETELATMRERTATAVAQANVLADELNPLEPEEPEAP